MTVLEILGVFGQSFGSSKGTVLAITAGGLSQSMAPTLVGLAVGILALWFHQYLNSQMETFDREMMNATVDLRNRLGVHIVRMMGPPMSPSRDRTPSAQTVRDAGTAANDLPIRDPRLGLELWRDRPGIFQLLLPRLESDREADTALAGAMWIAFVYGFLGWLSYFWQGRPNAGVLMFALFVVAGFGIRAGSRFAILCLFAFFAIACAACIACGGWALVPACLVVAPLMLAGGFRACRYAASLDRPSRVTSAERASNLAKPFWTVMRLVPIILVGPLLCCAILTVLFGTIFNICSMDADGSMAPSIPRGAWIMGLTPPVMGTIRRGDIVAFSPEWYSVGTSRVVGLPGDRLQVKSGKLIRNGQYMDEPYRQVRYRISYGDFPSNSKDVPYDFRWRHESAYGAGLKTDEPYVVPKEAYFVLNDDRNELLDSRVCGPVWQAYLYGKPVLAYHPSLRHWSLPRLIQ